MDYVWNKPDGWMDGLAPPGKYDWTCASFGTPESTTKWQIDRFSRFCSGRPFPPKLPLRAYGDLNPIWFMIPWASPSAQSKRHHDRFSRFCTNNRRALQCPFTMRRPFLLKIAHTREGPGSPSNTWFLEPTRVLNPNGIAIGLAVFAGLTTCLLYTSPSPRD